MGKFDSRRFPQFTGISMSSSGHPGDHFIYGLSSGNPVYGPTEPLGEAGTAPPYQIVCEDDVVNLPNICGTISISRASGEPVTSLRLQRQREYGDKFVPNNMPSFCLSSTPMKRSRVTYQTMQSPHCQVEGCNLDLKSAKDYHRRHRICESHSKSPKVIVAGMERRFCQQCSRFHDLSEFDDKKRSCRRRLSDHNARRRRVQPGSAALYDQRQQNLSLNALAIPLPNPTYEYPNTSMSRQAQGRFSPTFCFPTDQAHISISNLSTNSVRNLETHGQCLQETQSFIAAQDLLSAHTLLSSNSSWMEELGNWNPYAAVKHNELRTGTGNDLSLSGSNNSNPGGG